MILLIKALNMVKPVKRYFKERNHSSPWKKENHNLGAVFVHIPKNAGISIELAVFGVKVGHHPLYAYQVHNRKAFNNYYKFTVVRNPLDRLVSAYFFLKKGGRNEHDEIWSEKWLSRCKSFDEFCYALRDDDVYRKNVLSWQHFRPQWEYAVDLLGRVRFDYIARFESLQSDFGAIKKKLSLHSDLGHENKSGRDVSWRAYFSKDTAQIAAELYKKDICLFNYKDQIKLEDMDDE